jgi:ABC-2 type transport system permease protein
MSATAAEWMALEQGVAMSGARRLRMLWVETRLEFLKLLRTPAFSIPTLTFPAFFYVLFGLTLTSRGMGRLGMPTYLLASYGAFGALGVALGAFGIGYAMERGQGWLTLKRASPLPPAVYFGAKLLMSVAFGALVFALLALLAIAFGGVALSVGTWLLLATAVVLGAVPFCAFGLLLGSLGSPNAAPALVNLVHLPMAFLSGMWIPIQGLPPALRQAARFLPGYHYTQLALKPIGGDLGQSAWLHVGVLVVFGLACLAGAAWLWSREE